jgi:hypothetical protein
MPRLGLETGRRVEYLILNDPHPDGPVVGFFRELPITAAVVDHFGRRYIYAGVALRRRNGQYDIDSLARASGWSSLAWSIATTTPARCRTAKVRSGLGSPGSGQWLRHIYGIYIGPYRR